MGAMQNNGGKIHKGTSKRGSVKNADRLAAFRKGGNGGKADWGTCDAARIQTVVMGITKLGGAVTIGLSRDKGSHFMTLLLDQSKSTLWFNGDAHLDDELEDVITLLEEMAQE